jgi:hypothetical protein
MTSKTIKYYFFTIISVLSSSFSYTQIKISDTRQWVVNQSYEKEPDIDLNEI